MLALPPPAVTPSPIVLALAEAIERQARSMLFGKIVVEVAMEISVRDGIPMDCSVLEVKPRMRVHEPV